MEPCVGASSPSLPLSHFIISLLLPYYFPFDHSLIIITF